MAGWTRICPYHSLEPERGVVALVGGRPVAVFRLHHGGLAAIGNVDPFTGASVLARGIVGSRGRHDTVASPLHKQVFDLTTGVCLDGGRARVPVYAVRTVDGYVEVSETPIQPEEVRDRPDRAG